MFWVHAHSSARIEQSYRSIASAVRLRDVEDPRTDILGLVIEWLESDSSGDWLMVLDNADDISMLFSREAIHLPRNPRGRILITSRDRNAALQLTGREDRIIAVHGMNEEEAKLLLQVRLPNDRSNEKDRASLVLSLEHLPLAITQAAAYIATHTPKMTTSKYLKAYGRSEENQISLLSSDHGDLRRDPGLPNSVFTTWQISFEQIKIKNPPAAELLSHMCVLDRKKIPSYLFCDDNKPGFRDAVGTLVEFSLVRALVDDDSFEMHRLVQLATRKWLENHGETDKRREEMLHLMSEKFPTSELANWKICEDLEPHAQTILGYSYVSEHCQLDRARILHNTAWWRLTQGVYTIAEVRIQEAVAIRERMLGLQHLRTLDSLRLLASVLEHEGRYVEAEKLNLQVVVTMEKVLGREHPDTLSSLNNLASVYRNQGRSEEAEKLTLQIVKTMEKVLRPEHPDILSNLNNLASIYRNQGRFDEAEKLTLQVLESRTKILGQNHPQTLITVRDLALIYRSQGRYNEAEACEKQTLETMTRILGEDHPDTLVGMANLAVTLQSQGKYETAEEMGRRALEGYKRVLGLEHPRTSSAIANLASTYQNQGRFDEAEKLTLQVLESRTKILGQNHPQTLITVRDLALIYRSQGRYNEAEACEKQTLETMTRILGEDHPDTLVGMANLAVTLQSQGKYETAEEMGRRALEGYKRVLGLEHPRTSSAIANLASILRTQRKYEEADQLTMMMTAKSPMVSYEAE